MASAVFETGTKTFFINATAPIGWTKDTTNYNDVTLRVVNGTTNLYGSSGFSTIFSSRTISGTAPFSGLTTGSTTLGPTNLPAHTHTNPGVVGSPASYTNYTSMSGVPGTWPNTLAGAPALINSGANGTAGGHSHPFGTIGVNISGTLDLSVKYVDMILATKN